MIVVWPLIVSKTINPNILPGVCKSLEKYVFVHKIDEVMEAANKKIKKENSKTKTYLALQRRKKLTLESIEEDLTIDDYIIEAKGSSSNSPKGSSSNSPSGGYSGGGGKSNRGGGTKTGGQSGLPEKITPQTPQIGKTDQSLISNEPTWTHVQDQSGKVTAIGVKVVPFTIQNEQSLIKLMTSDRYRKSLSKNLQYEARKILRLMHRIANFSWKATVGLFSFTGLVDPDLQAGTITQDWKNDIILQNTAFGKNIFTMLDKMDLKDDFTHSASGVKGLFKLGWTSFVIADDINKTVSFCMNTYKGLCSSINYSFLYADARSQANVYRDLEDVKNSSGPLFRLSRRKRAMITDDLAQYKLNKYTQDSLVSESYLNENLIPELINKVKTRPKEVVSSLKAMFSAIKRKDVKTAHKISMKLNPSKKKIDVHNLINKNLKTNSEFKKNFDLSLRVFKNSLSEVPDDTLRIGAALISMLATINKNKSYNLKNDLKKIVIKTRTKSDDPFHEDMKLAFLFAVIFVVVAGPASVGFLYVLTSWMGTAGSAVFSVWPTIVIIAIFLYTIKILFSDSESKDKD